MPCQVPGRSKKLDSDFLVLFLDICLLYHLELLQRKYCLTAIIFVRCNDGFVEVSLVNVFITSPYKVHRHPTDVTDVTIDFFKVSKFIGHNSVIITIKGLHYPANSDG